MVVGECRVGNVQEGGLHDGFYLLWLQYSNNTGWNWFYVDATFNGFAEVIK